MKNIFNQFRDKSKALEQKPSDDAWLRLEQRLQAHQKPKARVLFFRRWAVAASLLAILSVGSVLSTVLLQQKDRFAEADITSLSEEELTLTDVPTYDVYSLRSNYSKASIEEGKSTKKLVAAVNYFYNETTDNQIDTASPSKGKSDAVESVERTVIDTLAQGFNWLVGNWKGKTEEGNSIEQWIKSDDVFYGTGYLVKETDTIFMERMKLVKRGKDWYYVLQLDPYSNSSTYKLEYFSPDKMIFSNRTRQFPAQIMLQKNEEDGFSTHLIARNHIELSSTQLDFLTKRNVLLLNKAVRNLVRQ